MPSIQQRCAIQLQMANNIANFVHRKPGIDGDTEIMEPEFGLFVAGPNVDMRGLIAFV